MTFKAKSTAISTAALRAIESYTAPEQRLFRDPFVRPLCGPFLGAPQAVFPHPNAHSPTDVCVLLGAQLFE